MIPSAVDLKLSSLRTLHLFLFAWIAEGDTVVLTSPYIPIVVYLPLPKITGHVLTGKALSRPSNLLQSQVL